MTGSEPRAEVIDHRKAAEFLGDTDFVSEKNLDRIFHIVRDPKDPGVILSMTVMEKTF